jgi:hypothetical protein
MKISTAERGRERIAVMGAQRMAHIMGISERSRRNSETRPKPPVSDDRRLGGNADLKAYASSLRRQENKAAGKSAAERRSRTRRGGSGCGLRSGAMTLR